MQILSVTLTNFKTHRDREFKFEPGTNTICGENGAGKTSVLEAIAWVLFNYVGSYKKADLIRNGTKSAQAEVQFISNRDHRTYSVRRCTTKGYTIFDPQLNQRLPYTLVDEEVLPWLREQFGVPPGTHLGDLFGNTIGVPQGTFTADFLKNPRDRKKVFDAVLKVEEYQQIFKDMNGLRKYAEAQCDHLKERLTQFEQQLAPWATVQARHATLGAEIAAQTQQLTELEQTLAELATRRSQGQTLLQTLQQTQAKLQGITAQLQAQTQQRDRLTAALTTAQTAAAICAATQASYTAYQELDQQVTRWEQRRAERQTLVKQRDRLDKSQRDRQDALTRTTLQLEQFAQFEQELASLAPQLTQQTELEQAQAEVQRQVQAHQASHAQLTAIAQTIQQLEQDQAKAIQQIQTLEALEKALAQAPDLDARRDRLQAQLNRIEAATQFRAELAQLLNQGQADRDRYQTEAQTALAHLATLQAEMPLLTDPAIAAVRQAIAAGLGLSTDLLTQLQRILADISEQVDVPVLQQKLQQVTADLMKRRQQEAQVVGLAERRSQLATLRTRLDAAQQTRTELQDQQAALAPLQAHLQDLTTQLAALNNPRARSQWLQAQLQPRSQIQTQHDTLVAAQGTIQQQIAGLDQKIAEFEAIEAELTDLGQQRQIHQADYRRYLEHQQSAQTLPRIQADHGATTAAIADLTTQQTQIQAELDALSAQVNPAELAQIDQQYQTAQSQADQLRGSLPQQTRLQQELDQQLQAFNEIDQQRQSAQQELKQRDRVRRFINFARKTYQQAGPRITQLYMHQISREGDRLFRDLMGRPNLSLRWDEEYDIIVQEGAEQRRFINLSGGEQMAAALAVRLALLKSMADLKIAFFDEPTTNMDRQRRVSLAEAIAQLKDFEQLFVISHDDTFEHITEHVISIERQV